jgi:3-deoxy-D-manno-octulosonic-acid transferase
MSFIYNFGIYLYLIAIRISSLFSIKAKKWLKGRKNIFEHLKANIDAQDKIAWFHAASLGEFEQGRPVIEAYKSKHPEYKILLTFFSPSGYEIRKNYAGADYIYYLPIDTKLNAKKFIRIVNPQVAVFIKYEYWFNYISELYKKNIPIFIVSAIFRADQHFFKPYGAWFRKRLKSITCFFVQNKHSIELLQSIGISNCIVSGDTRFDRVHEIATKAREFPLVEKFVGNKKVLLGGSTWPPDENLILSLKQKYKGSIKIIIAPHEVDPERIDSIKKTFAGFKTVLMSEADEQNIKDQDVLIIDEIGYLSGIYQYCFVAFIGGGFGKGIHNILEAVTFGKPVIFGPNFGKFKEATDLVEKGGAFNVNYEEDLFSVWTKLFTEEEFYTSASQTCYGYVKSNTGATQTILSHMDKYLQKQ